MQHLVKCNEQSYKFGSLYVCMLNSNQSINVVPVKWIVSLLQDTNHRVSTFLEFLETWKCQGIWLRSAKSQGKCQKSGKCQEICVVREIWLWQLNNMLVAILWCELCMNCDVHHGLRSSYNLPALYSYCNSYFMCDVRGEFGLINVHLFYILPAISLKSLGFSLFGGVVTCNHFCYLLTDRQPCFSRSCFEFHSFVCGSRYLRRQTHLRVVVECRSQLCWSWHWSRTSWLPSAACMT